MPKTNPYQLSLEPKMALDPNKKLCANIVLMGKMGSGKTYAANYLIEHYDAISWTVAERIKQVAHAVIGQTGNLGQLLEVILLDDEMERNATRRLLKFADEYRLEPGRPRKLYQEVGQILRDINTNTRFCWEEDLDRRIEACPSPMTVIDVRSKEGYDFFCRQQDFIPIRIDAPLEMRKQRLLEEDKGLFEDESVFYHQSETDVDELEFEYVINNAHNDLHQFYMDLELIIQEIGQPLDANTKASKQPPKNMSNEGQLF